MKLIVRPMVEEDSESYKRLFEEAYGEYLESLRQSNPKQFQQEKRERRKVTRARFEFYLKSGSSFVAEENGEVIGYVASQSVSFMHGVDRLLWIEYIVVKSEHRRKGVGTALMRKLIDYVKRIGVDRVYTTINPDNEASIKLHEKSGFNVRNWRTASLKAT